MPAWAGHVVSAVRKAKVLCESEKRRKRGADLFVQLSENYYFLGRIIESLLSYKVT